MKNRTPAFLAALIVLPSCLLGSPGNDSEVIKLPPFSDTYKWHEFLISRDHPVSKDGRFKLLRVLENGDVEVFRLDVSDAKAKPTLVKPLSEEMKKPGLPTLVVVSSDFKKQMAKLNELRAN